MNQTDGQASSNREETEIRLALQRAGLSRPNDRIEEHLEARARIQATLSELRRAMSEGVPPSYGPVFVLREGFND